MKKLLLCVGLVLGICSVSLGQMYEHTEAEVEAKYEQCVLKGNEASTARDGYNAIRSENWQLYAKSSMEYEDLQEQTQAQYNEHLLGLGAATRDPDKREIMDSLQTQITSTYNTAVDFDILAGAAKQNHNWDVAFQHYTDAITNYQYTLNKIELANLLIGETTPIYNTFLNELSSYVYGTFSEANCTYDESEQLYEEVTVDKNNVNAIHQTTVNRMNAYYNLYGADQFYIGTLVPLANQAGEAKLTAEQHYGDSGLFKTQAVMYLSIADLSLSEDKIANALDSSHNGGQKSHGRKVLLNSAKNAYEQSYGYYYHLNTILDEL